MPGGRGYKLHFERYRGSALDEHSLNRAVENLIRRCPTQYLWSYNRHKVPRGVPSPAAERVRT
jgi:KDO2-lipid IV(A) lauroyltransferase